jgi:predicted DNA-binding transcriptional regulator AlpA
VSEVLLTEREMAALLRVTPRCLQYWRASGEGPLFIKVGKLVRYRESGLDPWLASKTEAGKQ